MTLDAYIGKDQKLEELKHFLEHCKERAIKSNSIDEILELYRTGIILDYVTQRRIDELKDDVQKSK